MGYFAQGGGVEIDAGKEGYEATVRMLFEGVQLKVRCWSETEEKELPTSILRSSRSGP